MNNEEIREYCLAKTGVTESLPFSDAALVAQGLIKMSKLASLVPSSLVATRRIVKTPGSV